MADRWYGWQGWQVDMGETLASIYRSFQSLFTHTHSGISLAVGSMPILVILVDLFFGGGGGVGAESTFNIE